MEVSKLKNCYSIGLWEGITIIRKLFLVYRMIVNWVEQFYQLDGPVTAQTQDMF